MKKLCLSVLLLFSAIILSSSITYATSTSYTWNNSTTHSFQTMPINQTRILVDDVAVFEYGVVLDTDYKFDFTGAFDFDTHSVITHISSTSWKSIWYESETYGRSGSGTYFDDKTVTWEIDYDYVPTTIYHQITVLNRITYLGRYFVEDGTIFTQPNDPTSSGRVFQFWYDKHLENNGGIVTEYNFNQQITKSLLLSAHYIDATVPEWIFDSSYGATDYDYHYYTSSDTVHKLESSVLNYFTIYADGELIFDRGTTVDDTAYTFNSGIGIELEITDVVNSTTSTYYSTGVITNNITTIDELIIIHSVSPQNIYVFDDELMHPFDLTNNVEFDIYRQEDTVLKDTIENELYQIKWFAYGTVIQFSVDSSLTFRNSLSTTTPYAIARTNDTSTWVVVYTDNSLDTFNAVTSFNHNYLTSTINVSFLDSETIQLTTDLDVPITTQIDITSYMETFEVGKAYKITFDGVLSSMDVSYTVLTDEFSPVFVPGYRNMELDTSAFYHDDSVVFKYDSTTQFFIKLTDVEFTPDEPTTYKLYIEEVIAHDVEFDKSIAQLNYNTSRFVFMSRTNLILPKTDALGGQTIEHYTQVADPTFQFEEENDDDYTIIAYYEEETNLKWDFDDPVIEDTELNPVIVPNYAFAVAFDSNGGSHVETQFLFELDSLDMPPTPTKEGYTFNGWYTLPDFPDGLETPISTLGNNTLRDLFEVEGMILDSEQLVTNGDFSDGTTGWTGYRGDLSIVSSALRITATTSLNAELGIFQSLDFVEGGKYYLNFNIKTENLTNFSNDYVLYLTGGSGNQTVSIDTNKSYVFTSTYDQTSFFIWAVSSSTFITGDYIDFNNVMLFDYSDLIANKQYSPIYNTTFDLMSDAEIKTQMDAWVLDGIENVNLISYAHILTLVPTMTIDQLNYWYSVYDYFNNGTLPDLTEATLYDFQDVPMSSMTLFAKWTENPPLTYTVTFNSSQGSYVAPTTVEDGSFIERPSDPYKEGYDFIGWSSTPQGETLWSFPSNTVTEDMILYAVWDVPDVPQDTTITDNETVMMIADNWIWIVGGLTILLLALGYGTQKRRKGRRY